MDLDKYDPYFAQTQCMAHGLPVDTGESRRSGDDGRTKKVGVEFFTVKEVKLELRHTSRVSDSIIKSSLGWSESRTQTNLFPGESSPK